MRITWLAWNISGMLLLLAVLTSLFTFAPPIRWLGVVLPLVFGGGAVLVAGIAALLGRLPSTHWAQRSRPVWALIAAIVLTMLIVFGVLIG